MPYLRDTRPSLLFMLHDLRFDTPPRYATSRLYVTLDYAIFRFSFSRYFFRRCHATCRYMMPINIRHAILWLRHFSMLFSLSLFIEILLRAALIISPLCFF